jgi:hypothetical protein
VTTIGGVPAVPAGRWARIRKALVAAGTAAAGTAVTGFWQAADGGLSDQDIAQVVTAALLAGLVAGRATWRVRNAPPGSA